MAQNLILTDIYGTTLDLSAYCRVQEDGELDPYPDFEEPAFIDSALAEGNQLGSVTINNREFVYPIWVTAASKDTMQALVSTIARAAGNIRGLAWRDDGATNTSYLDPTYAKVQPSYKFFKARKCYLACVLRIYCAPPYAHTGTERIIGTGVASNAAGFGAGTFTIPAGSVIGDVPAMLKARIDMSGEIPGPLGRIVGLAAIPAGWSTFIPAASMVTLAQGATLIGASGAPGSQVIAPATSQLAAVSRLARFSLAASPYAGRNRVMALVRPARVPGLAVQLIDEFGMQLGPTGVVKGLGGMQLVDLGVANVPTSQATHRFGVGLGGVKQTAADEELQLLVGADRSMGQLAGVYILPEEAMTAQIDPGHTVAGQWFANPEQASAAWPRQMTDDYGNGYASVAATGFLATSGLSLKGDGILAVPACQDLRHRTLLKLNNASAGFTANIMEGASSGITPGVAVSLGQPNATVMGFAIAAYNQLTGGVQFDSIDIPSQGPLYSGGSHVLIVDVVKQGVKAYANLRITNATGVQLNGTYVPVACVGLTHDLVGQSKPRNVILVTSANGASAIILGHWLDQLKGAAGASDAYTLDGAQQVSFRSPVGAGSAVHPLTDRIRGAQLRLDPAANGLTVFSVDRDGGPMNDPFGVEIRVRERFRFMVK